MRILYSHRIGSRDGQSVHIEELVAALRRIGHEVLVVGPSVYDKAEFGGDSGLVRWIRRRLPRALNEFAELGYNLPAYRRLRRAALSFKPDLIYERYNLYYLAGTMLARRIRVPLFLEVNAPLAEERGRYNGLGLEAAAHAIERFTWRSARRVLTVTDVLKDRVVHSGVPAERVSVTPNGIDPDQFATLPARKPDDRPLILGFVGFVRDWHGLDSVIKALAAYRGSPPAQLMIVGNGPARPDLERQVAALGISDSVEFTGLADRSAIPALVGGFDIALQPRVVDYASPLKIFEYMAAGRAIVAPDQPNIREILTHERTALLFDPTNDTAMWAAVARLLADGSLRQKLGDAARETIQQRDYTWLGNANRVAAWAQADLDCDRRDTQITAVAAPSMHG
ncbi:MAG TPA: glycosyltransferase family 4 protein [Acetobacteraceae bacterium]|nr:glycosyltransferase family 4 protein [Acetobacteraceae bacterium]